MDRDVEGMEERLQGVSEHLHTATLLHGCLVRKTLAGATEKGQIWFETLVSVVKLHNYPEDAKTRDCSKVSCTFTRNHEHVQLKKQLQMFNGYHNLI